MSANLRAFLAMVRWCEGTADDNGYRALYGHRRDRPKVFDSFHDHPRQYFSTPWGKTSAAGAYQFLAGTWDDARFALGLPDFSPRSQDEAAAWLVKRRGALEDVEAGRLREAIARCAKEWASLPGSPYGQPTRTLAECERIYLAAGGHLAGAASQQAGPPAGAPAPSPAAPPPAPAPAPAPAAPAAPYIDPMRTPEEAAADANWERIERERRDQSAGADTINHAAPTLTGAPAMPLPAAAVIALGSELIKLLPFARQPQRAEQVEAVAAQLVKIAQAVQPGAVNEQQAVDQVRANPQLQRAFMAQAASQWQEIEPLLQFEAGERKEARRFAVQLTEGEGWRAIGAGLLVGALSLTIILGGGAMFWSLMSSPQLDPGQKGLILGALLSVFSSTAAYWFGSSASSRQKDQTISEQAKR